MDVAASTSYAINPVNSGGIASEVSISALIGLD